MLMTCTVQYQTFMRLANAIRAPNEAGVVFNAIDT
jgi:hypothetical protein